MLDPILRPKCVRSPPKYTHHQLGDRWGSLRQPTPNPTQSGNRRCVLGPYTIDGWVRSPHLLTMTASGQYIVQIA
ncbi:MAG: hypothetical protein VKJ46_04390 [Leptolyngbyaceae bacterium]|nr:hypothetical protein [Leptolyngbyaceae bacterium]